MKQNKHICRYLRQVRSWLPCSRSLKKQVLAEIRDKLTEYEAEFPAADYGDLTARFGTPRQIAAAYVEEQETGALLRDLRIRRKIVRILSATALVLIFIWGAYVLSVYSDYLNSRDGYMTEEIIITGESK